MRAILALAVLATASCLWAESSWAASLETSPVFIGLSPGQTSAAIEIQNRDQAPVAIQVRAFSWQQTGDKDVLTPTLDVILSPPIFTIPADSSQTLRLLMRNPGADSAHEHSYRLWLDEVPSASTVSRRIQTALRISLPIIADPPSSRPGTVQWRLEHTADGQVQLTAINGGPVYAKVDTVEVTLPDGSHPKAIRQAENPYVLPGAQRHWLLQGHVIVADAPIHLTTTTQAGKSDWTLMP